MKTKLEDLKVGDFVEYNLDDRFRYKIVRFNKDSVKIHCPLNGTTVWIKHKNLHCIKVWKEGQNERNRI